MAKREKRRCSVCRRWKWAPNDFQRSGVHKSGNPAFKTACKACCAKSTEAKRAAQRPPPVEPKTALPKAGRYVVTYAQNATPVYGPFFRSLLQYCRERRAKLVVIPGRYKNPTSIFHSARQGEEWWAPELKPYLYRGKFQLARTLRIIADISIQPTAVRPLTGFEVYAGQASAIFGHPRIQLRTIPTASRRYPRILVTTGAVTRANYTDSKAGKKGEAHHVFGATVVESDGEHYHIRQINALKNGSFIDLNSLYDGREAKSSRAPRPVALVCGDIHVENTDRAVVKATFDGPGSIVGTLRPERIVYHDVLDFSVRNHHRINDFDHRYTLATGPRTCDRVGDEVQRTIEFIDEKTPPDSEPIVVASNHDEAFDRWLRTADFRQDPTNARFFLETWVHLMEEYDAKGDGEFPPAFEVVYRRHGKRDDTRFLRRDDSFALKGIHFGYHGDKGWNGARAGELTYAKLGVKTVTGHTHSPAITDGHYCVGATAELDQGYNRLPSSWLHSHCVVYANGKRSLIHVIDGRWRG